MRHSVRNVIITGAATFMLYLPASQATTLYYGHQPPRASIGYQHVWRGKGNRHRGDHFNRRGFNPRGFYSKRRGHFGKRGYGHFRGKHRGNRFGHRGFNRGNLHGFNGRGYYQKRKHYYRDQFGRLRYFYR